MDNDGQCLDVAGGSTSNNAAIDQWGCKSSDQSNRRSAGPACRQGPGEFCLQV